MHNESLADRESDAVIKSSKLTRIRDAAITTGIIAIPVVLTGASFYFGLKMTKMQLETARLSLEAAKLKAS